MLPLAAYTHTRVLYSIICCIPVLTKMAFMAVVQYYSIASHFGI